MPLSLMCGSPAKKLQGSATKLNRPLQIDVEGTAPHTTSWHGLIQAATAAKYLKCDYLWLDLLCLNQRSKNDKKLQIKNMANIYRNSTAVLVMFGGCAAAQGLNKYSSWIDRAWTLQEATLGETYALIEWPFPGYNGHFLNVASGIEKLDGEIAIVSLEELLEVNPEERYKAYISEAERPTLKRTDPDHQFQKSAPSKEIEIDFSIQCLGSRRLPISALQAVLGLTYDNYKRKREVRLGAAWRSMWLRTSTKPQDMVFSMIHLLDVDIEVDYDHSLEDLIFELVAKTASFPAWLTIAHNVPVVPNSGLIPVLPTFTANSFPTYLVGGKPYPAANILSDGGLCFKYDIILTTSSKTDGIDICAQMLEVDEIGHSKSYHNEGDKDLSSSYLHKSELHLSGPNYHVWANCWFEGEMGSVAIVTGQRSIRFMDMLVPEADPFVILARKSSRGIWEKVGAGRLVIQYNSLADVPRRHLRVGGKSGSEIVPCDCSEGREKGPFKTKDYSSRPWVCKEWEADEARRRKQARRAAQSER